jgi:hypothetical protein
MSNEELEIILEKIRVLKQKQVDNHEQIRKLEKQLERQICFHNEIKKMKDFKLRR